MCVSGSVRMVHVHERVHVIVREVGGGRGNPSLGLIPVTTFYPPHSYVENQQHLHSLELRDLQGLGQLRNL